MLFIDINIGHLQYLFNVITLSPTLLYFLSGKYKCECAHLRYKLKAQPLNTTDMQIRLVYIAITRRMYAKREYIPIFVDCNSLAAAVVCIYTYTQKTNTPRVILNSISSNVYLLFFHLFFYFHLVISSLNIIIRQVYSTHIECKYKCETNKKILFDNEKV